MRIDKGMGRFYDKEKENIYNFTIPKGYCYDGASVPKFFYRVIGANTDNKFLIAALIQIFLGDVVESLIIFAVLILNSILGVVQTKKAEGRGDAEETIAGQHKCR